MGAGQSEARTFLTDDGDSGPPQSNHSTETPQLRAKRLAPSMPSSRLPSSSSVMVALQTPTREANALCDMPDTDLSHETRSLTVDSTGVPIAGTGVTRPNGKVNHCNDQNGPDGEYPWGMNALRQRILHLLKEVGMSVADVASEMAKDKEFSDQTLKQFLSRSKDNAETDMKFRGVVKIAQITGGSIRWLATGEPPMLDTGPRSIMTSKSLALALAKKMVERGEAGEGALEMLAADPAPAEDVDVPYWMDRFVEYARIERQYSVRVKQAEERRESDPPSAPTIRLRKR